MSAFLAVGLFVYTFRSGLSDILYTSVRNWRLTVFVVLCIAAGLVMGFRTAGHEHDGISSSGSLFSSLQDDEQTAADAIRSCKLFVLSRAQHLRDYTDPEPSLGDVITIGAQSYWDTCAHVFGTNYWKHDITINGEEGGRLLCRAWRESGQPASHAAEWCNTVFTESRGI